MSFEGTDAESLRLCGAHRYSRNQSRDSLIVLHEYHVMAGLNLFDQIGKLSGFDFFGDDHGFRVIHFARGVEFPYARRSGWLQVRLFWVGDVGCGLGIVGACRLRPRESGSRSR